MGVHTGFPRWQAGIPWIKIQHSLAITIGTRTWCCVFDARPADKLLLYLTFQVSVSKTRSLQSVGICIFYIV